MYRYENHTLGRADVMSVLSEDAFGNGPIGWQNQPWQGYFEFMPDNSVELAFDCYGEGNIQSTKLWNVGKNKWKGFDYDGKHVTITKVSLMRYDGEFWQDQDKSEKDEGSSCR